MRAAIYFAPRFRRRRASTRASPRRPCPPTAKPSPPPATWAGRRTRRANYPHGFLCGRALRGFIQRRELVRRPVCPAVAQPRDGVARVRFPRLPFWDLRLFGALPAPRRRLVEVVRLRIGGVGLARPRRARRRNPPGSTPRRCQPAQAIDELIDVSLHQAPIRPAEDLAVLAHLARHSPQRVEPLQRRAGVLWPAARRRSARRRQRAEPVDNGRAARVKGRMIGVVGHRSGAPRQRAAARIQGRQSGPAGMHRYRRPAPCP